MNEAQVRTLEQVREVLAGTHSLEMGPVADETGRYGWIEAALKRFDYRCLKCADRGVVLTYLQRISGYSRAQVTRLVSRWVAGKRLVKQYRARWPPRLHPYRHRTSRRSGRGQRPVSHQCG